jgi:hypothetical protein
MANLLIILIFLVNSLSDSKKTSNSARNKTIAIAGKVSSNIKVKLFQYDAIVEKSEKISEKKLRNPDCAKPAESILKAGIKATAEATSINENKTIFLSTKTRSSR